MKKVFKRFAIASPFILAFSIMVTSCSKDNAVANNKVNVKATAQITADTYTSEDVFRGIILFEGPVADLLPSISPLEAKNFVTTTQSYDIFLTQYEQAYPGDIDNFKAVMESGDANKISATIASAMNNMATVINTNNATDTTTIKNDTASAQDVANFNTALANSGINYNDPKQMSAFISQYQQANPAVFAQRASSDGAGLGKGKGNFIFNGYFIIACKNTIEIWINIHPSSSAVRSSTLLSENLVNDIVTNLTVTQ